MSVCTVRNNEKGRIAGRWNFTLFNNQSSVAYLEETTFSRIKLKIERQEEQQTKVEARPSDRSLVRFGFCPTALLLDCLPLHHFSHLLYVRPCPPMLPAPSSLLVRISFAHFSTPCLSPLVSELCIVSHHHLPREGFSTSPLLS
jgi:hypothetical protein